jgi:hypothetical protein
MKKPAGSRIGSYEIVALLGEGGMGEFRAAWIDHGSAFIVNRNANTSHIVLFDRFWSAAR